jgi:hypothetical protein
MRLTYGLTYGLTNGLPSKSPPIARVDLGVGAFVNLSDAEDDRSAMHRYLMRRERLDEVHASLFRG